jgi:mitochondrial Rho GTPase 1
MGIEVSARDNKNILEMLYCAQSSVIFPLSPLMNLAERSLTVKYKKALTRIFRILDTNGNGTLNDAEMTALQMRVFDNELTADDLKSLKDIVKEDVSWLSDIG